MQYFEHVDPGKLGGGWVDTYNVGYVDRYSEQLWLTVFGKAKEMTLFNYIDLLKEAKAGTGRGRARAATFRGSGLWSGRTVEC